MSSLTSRSTAGLGLALALILAGTPADSPTAAAATENGASASSSGQSRALYRALGWGDRRSRRHGRRAKNSGNPGNGKAKGNGNSNGNGNGNAYGHGNGNSNGNGNGNAYGHGNGNGNSNGNGNGNAYGHGNGNGNSNGNGNGNGNAYGHGNGNPNPGGPATPGAGQGAPGNSNGNGNGQAIPGNPQGNPGNANGQLNGNGNANGNPGNGNAQPNLGNNGNGNGQGNANGHTDPGKGNGNGQGNGNSPVGPPREELAWLDNELADLAQRVSAYYELYLKALKSGDKAEAAYALEAVNKSVEAYFAALTLRGAAFEYFEAVDEYAAAVAAGDPSRATRAYEVAIDSYTKTVAATPTAEPSDLPPPAEPVAGSNVGAEPAAGIVAVKTPGGEGFIPLVEGASIPVGSVVDTRYGAIEITAAAGPGGATQSAIFRGSQFVIRQVKARRPITELVLRGGDLGSCNLSAAGSAVVRMAQAGATRRLWGRGKGRFRTRGSHGIATVRGTHWLTEDRCDGTLVAVRSGVVEVRDLGLERTVMVRAGGRYLARANRR